MPRFIIIPTLYFVFCILYFSSSTPSSSSWIQQSIDLTINTRFAEAESLLTGRMADGDSSLEVRFYYASVLNSKMTHFEKTDQHEHFLRVIKSVIDDCDRALDDKNYSEYSRAKLYFFRGSALGYLAFFQGQNGSWYPAFKNGLKARDNLENAVQYDPGLYDAYLGIGAFQYWVSTKFRWLPLVSDKREQGIENIKKAVEHSKHSRFMAMHQLIYILLDYGKYDQAYSYAQNVIEAYPQSQFMWWAHAHTLYKMKRNEEALEAYYTLLQLIENDPAPNPMHWVGCNVKLAEIYQRLDRPAKAREHCQLVLSTSFTEDQLTEPGEKSLEKARELLKILNIQ